VGDLVVELLPAPGEAAQGELGGLDGCGRSATLEADGDGHEVGDVEPGEAVTQLGGGGGGDGV